MSRPGHLKVLAAFNAARVDYVVVGAMALGHYAPDSASFYVTADCDILVRPTAANLRKALRLLVRSGYRLSAGGEPLVGIDDLILKRLLQLRATVLAESENGMPIDLMVDAIGYSFDEWRLKRTLFKVEGVRVPCASLEHILESKHQAGRDKDKKLLALYESAYRPLLRRGGRRKKH